MKQLRVNVVAVALCPPPLPRSAKSSPPRPRPHFRTTAA